MRAQRAAWISSLSTSTVPRPRGSAATCDAHSRLRGPSAETSEPLRIAPANTTSDSTVRSQKNAVSSIVSVPWVTTTPPPDARRATSSIVSGVTFQPLTWATLSTSTGPEPRHGRHEVLGADGRPHGAGLGIGERRDRAAGGDQPDGHPPSSIAAAARTAATIPT